RDMARHTPLPAQPRAWPPRCHRISWTRFNARTPSIGRIVRVSRSNVRRSLAFAGADGGDPGRRQAAAERDDDGETEELAEAHDDGDGRGHRHVVVLEGLLVGGDGDGARGAGRLADQ